MPSTKKDRTLYRLLCADHRFTPPDVINDHCWEVRSPGEQQLALSVTTTYGLRASQMQIFPSFMLNDQTVLDPGQFFSQPVVLFSSTNFITLSFSPFQGIDVIYNIWVPNSQMLVGEMVCHNRTTKTCTLGVNWQVNLTPLREGSPMKHVQRGLTTVLQGECANIFPVFYLPGDVTPSASSTPGLSGKYLLMPSAEKQITWALASLSSVEASFYQARQYSSKPLDIEKLKVEMADKREMMIFSSDDGLTAQVLQFSQVRALQLVMPPQGIFRHPTFVTKRGTDNGYYPHPDQIGIYPEWSGQTLTDIWMMMQTLLPGQAHLIKGFISNSLTRQSENGRVDHQLGAGGTQTGHSALPMLAQLVAELHPHLNDLPWLEEIYPRLLSFLRSWLDLETEATPRVKGLTHPVQIGLNATNDQQSLCASELWIKLQTNSNFFVLTLLIREITDLILISRWLEKEDEIKWLESLREQLIFQTLQLWDNKAGYFYDPAQTKNTPWIRVYKRNGGYKPGRNLPFPSQVYLRVTGEGQLTSGFSCAIKGHQGDHPLEITLHQTDMLALGSTRLYVSEQSLTAIDTIEIKDLPAGMSIEIGQPSNDQADISQLMSLYAGVLTSRQADLLLRKVRARDFFGEKDVTLLPSGKNNSAPKAPPCLVGMIIDGLLRYKKVWLAEQVFNQHFLDPWIGKLRGSKTSIQPTRWTVEDLIPARLFLKIRGVVSFTQREVILSHFIKLKRDALTVQYNKIELRLKPYLTEIHTQTGEVIYLNRAGPNRILLE